MQWLLQALLLDHRKQIGMRGKSIGPEFQAHPRRDDPETKTVIDGRGHRIRRHAALAIVEMGLDQLCRLAGIHSGKFVM